MNFYLFSISVSFFVKKGKRNNGRFSIFVSFFVKKENEITVDTLIGDELMTLDTHRCIENPIGLEPLS